MGPSSFLIYIQFMGGGQSQAHPVIPQFVVGTLTARPAYGGTLMVRPLINGKCSVSARPAYGGTVTVRPAYSGKVRARPAYGGTLKVNSR